VAYAPFEDPQVVVSVVLENVGGGSTHAAPVARAMLDAYLLPDPPPAEEAATDE
jgi:penicillin-binding protein 2